MRSARELARMAAALLLLGCNNDDDPGDGSDGGDDGPWPHDGMIGCPEEDSCVFVFVSQALDDRVDVFDARAEDPYVGAIDLDLKPNPGGDNGGENLDEPYGLALLEGGLSVLIGHYPAVDAGSLVTLPFDLMTSVPRGSTIPLDAFFIDGTFAAGAQGSALDEQEAIFVVPHPSGRLLIAVFNNDLLGSPTEWTEPGKLLVVDPAQPAEAVGRIELAGLGAAGTCAGAWRVVALDPDVNAIAVACDGDEGVAILDTSGVEAGSPADAADGVTGCVADLPFPDKRVRALAPDGLGGVLVAETPQILANDPARLWRYDGECQMLGGVGTAGVGAIWDLRRIVPSGSGSAEPHWLLAQARGADRGVYVVSGARAEPEVCGKLDALDALWDVDGEHTVDPHALALTRTGDGLAIGAGQDAVSTTSAGHGRVLWADLDVGDEPCSMSATVTDLTQAAPAVDPANPATWRRAPDVVIVREIGR